MAIEMFNSCKVTNLIKNKYGKFVLNKALFLLVEQDKFYIKEIVMQKQAKALNKEKAKFIEILELF